MAPRSSLSPDPLLSVSAIIVIVNLSFSVDEGDDKEDGDTWLEEALEWHAEKEEDGFLSFFAEDEGRGSKVKENVEEEQGGEDDDDGER